MATSSVGSDRLRRHGPGFAVDEDHFLNRITAVVAGAGALAVVVPFVASATRSSVGAATAAAAGLAIVAATGWMVTRFRRPHLVLSVDRAGIMLGPALWAYLRGRSDREFVSWRQVRHVHLFAVDYSAEPHNYALIRHHLRISCVDGRSLERALPVGTDADALDGVLRQLAPRLLVEGRVVSRVSIRVPRPRSEGSTGPMVR